VHGPPTTWQGGAQPLFDFTRQVLQLLQFQLCTSTLPSDYFGASLEELNAASLASRKAW
jgi:hypothetical protein